MRIKSKFAAALTALCTASLLSVPAHAVSWSGDDGWEVHYTGFINLFYNQLEFSKLDNNATGGVNEDSSLLNEGLLPSFHTMKAKSPTVNGLTGTSQITFAVDTSTDKAVNLNKSGAGGDDLIDLREVFFNVEGSFGTISVGRTLALYQRQAILKDMTLFGVGAMANPDSNGTALGRIGSGYVYPDFRARFLWQSPDLHGAQLSLGVFQPRETTAVAGTTQETDIPMFQGEMTYNFSQQGLDANFWAGFLWQEVEVRIASESDDVRVFGWNVGGQMNFAGLGLTGSYYRGKGLGTLFVQPGGAGCIRTTDNRLECGEATAHGGYLQGTYTFEHGGDSKTKLGVSWGYSSVDNDRFVGNVRDANGRIADIKTTNHGITGGVYHDVNSWLKVVGEYNTYEYDALNQEVEGFSVGAFMFW